MEKNYICSDVEAALSRVSRVVTRESINIGFGLINEQPDCLRTLKLCSTSLNMIILNILLPEFSS